MLKNKPKYTEGIKMPNPIPLEAIITMKNLLKSLSLDWAKELAELMYPQTDQQKKKDPYNEVGAARVYNIIANQIKNNGARVEFISKGEVLLARYEAMQKEAFDIIEKRQLSS